MSGKTHTPETTVVSATVGALAPAERRLLARRLLLRGVVGAPLILASVLTTKAVAQTKIVLSQSIPLSL